MAKKAIPKTLSVQVDENQLIQLKTDEREMNKSNQIKNDLLGRISKSDPGDTDGTGGVTGT